MGELIEQLQGPKLRWGNKEREWKTLERYQRGLNSLLNFALCLYVMGLYSERLRS